MCLGVLRDGRCQRTAERLRDPAMGIGCVSVDLDEIPNYAAIHGVAGASVDPHAVYDRGLPRLAEWAERHDLPLTLFAIGQDLRRESARVGLSQLLGRGHEIANHSLDHRYDLTRLAQPEMRHQVEAAQQLFERELGVIPKGFRAPGYTTTDALYSVLEELGFTYSSSVFPCPPYYAAKLAAVAAKRLLGKRSASVIDHPRVLLCPRRPYRVGDPYWRRGSGLVELPMQTTPWLRLPFIGTTLTLSGATVSRWLARRVRHEPLVNLELHGIDVLDATDGLQGLADVQPDLRVPLRSKLEALDAAVATLREGGCRFLTLEQAVGELGLS